MKSATAYYLLLFYIVAVCKPVLPLLGDAYAHEFHEAEHISTIHLVFGQHHASKEFNAATGSDDAASNSSSGKSAEPVSIHIITRWDYKYCTRPCLKYHYSLFMTYLLHRIHDVDTPPPEC